MIAKLLLFTDLISLAWSDSACVLQTFLSLVQAHIIASAEVAVQHLQSDEIGITHGTVLGEHREMMANAHTLPLKPLWSTHSFKAFFTFADALDNLQDQRSKGMRIVCKSHPAISTHFRMLRGKGSRHIVINTQISIPVLHNSG